MQLPSTHLSVFAALLAEPVCDAAWKRFLDRYEPVIRGWCARHGLRGADADDLAQEIALKLCKGLPRYDPRRGRFRDWLARLVGNAVRDWRRNRRRRPADRGVGGDGPLAALADLSAPDNLAAALEDDISGETRRLLEQVQVRAPESWPAFSRHILEGRPAEEVARELGKRVGAIYQACSRVKAMLKQLSPTLGGTAAK